MKQQATQFSYWEQQTWFANVDFAIVGSGIVGLNAAITIKRKHPTAKVLVIERGILPQGASTKNAGFACFGSLSEILSDLKRHSAEEVVSLVKMRYEGLQLLRKNLGDATIDYQQHGSYELFTNQDELFEQCAGRLQEVNTMLYPIFNDDVFSICSNHFQFNNVANNYVFNQFEGQIDTGKMMHSLLRLAQSEGVLVLNNITVTAVDSDHAGAIVSLDSGMRFTAKKVCVATNGFASQLLEESVQPARAQVLVTKPIKNLHIKGTFHLDEGYYYFRNIHDRVLFGGGRNLDFKGEETTDMKTTALIQDELERLLKTVILPETPFEVDQRWTGIMGVGEQKNAIIKQVSAHVYCGVRMGGMGVAIGSLVGKELAELVI